MDDLNALVAPIARRCQKINPYSCIEPYTDIQTVELFNGLNRTKLDLRHRSIQLVYGFNQVIATAQYFAILQDPPSAVKGANFPFAIIGIRQLGIAVINLLPKAQPQASR